MPISVTYFVWTSVTYFMLKCDLLCAYQCDLLCAYKYDLLCVFTSKAKSTEPVWCVCLLHSSQMFSFLYLTIRPVYQFSHTACSLCALTHCLQLVCTPVCQWVISLLYLFLYLKAIACEVFKSLNDLNPSFMKEMFEKKDVVYDLRNPHHLYRPIFKKITYGKNTFKYYGSHIWNLLPNDLKKKHKHKFL